MWFALYLYGTGLRNRESLDSVATYKGNERLPVQTTGPQGRLDGVDQITVPLSEALRGVGQVAVCIVVNGLSSNTVTVNIN